MKLKRNLPNWNNSWLLEDQLILLCQLLLQVDSITRLIQIKAELLIVVSK